MSYNEKPRDDSRGSDAGGTNAPLLGGIASTLFAATLAGQGLLHALLLAWFQVERMPLDVLNDVFLLDFTFKAP